MIQDFFLFFHQDANGRIPPDTVQSRAAVVQRHSRRPSLFICRGLVSVERSAPNEQQPQDQGKTPYLRGTFSFGDRFAGNIVKGL